MGGDKLREEMDKGEIFSFFFYNIDDFNRKIMQSK